MYTLELLSLRVFRISPEQEEGAHLQMNCPVLVQIEGFFVHLRNPPIGWVPGPTWDGRPLKQAQMLRDAPGCSQSVWGSSFCQDVVLCIQTLTKWCRDVQFPVAYLGSVLHRTGNRAVVALSATTDLRAVREKCIFVDNHWSMPEHYCLQW